MNSGITFDLRKLKGAEIRVRRATAGEPFLPLGEHAKAIKLSPDDLVIADAERPVALAGVKGGAETSVDEGTVDVLLEALPLDADAASHARRAAHLCKHDLVSQMVGEFPELQGVMGGKYLLAEGEPREVALAVLEHYLPRGAGDDLPSSDAGAVVAVAERLELLLSIYAKGERPSGSSDPYALRRAGNGLLQILWERGWRLDLQRLLSRATAHWAELLPHFKVDAAALAGELGEFLRQRLQSLLEEDGVAADLVQAVAGDGVAATVVSYIRSDETPHVEYLRTALGELRTRTIRTVDGGTISGGIVVDRLYSMAIADSLGDRRAQQLAAAEADVVTALDGRADAADLLAEFRSLAA